MQRRKSLTISIFSLLLAVCLALGLFFTLYKSDVASAARGDAFTVIGDVDNDLYKGGSKPFNVELLTELFKALTGKSDFDDVKNLLEDDADHALTSEDFRTVQGNANTGNNVSVWLGGKKWDAVHMTTVRARYSGSIDGDLGVPEDAGDIVLTLWQSADNVPEEKTKFTTHASTGDPYPASMYTPSYTRVVVLNAGGSYSTTGTDVVSYTQKTSENENTYARFTSPLAKDSLTPYIVKPKDIEYQETESGSLTAKSVCGSYYLPNDAYGTPAAGTCALSDYATKGSGETAYNYWRNDYLWLPSFAETGLSDSVNSNGVWLTNAPLRSAMPGTGNWVRSSAYDVRNRPLYLTADGSNTYCGSTDEHHVRPAIHINISKIAEEAGALAPAKPAEEDLNKSLEYTGEAQQWTLPELDDTTYIAQGDDTAFWSGDTKTITATNAGEYKVEVTPPTDGWKDGSKDPVTFTLTITPAKIEVKFDDSSESKKQARTYTYHKETEHEIELSKDIIKIIAPETNTNINISYLLRTHKENEYADKDAHDKAVFSSPPAIEDEEWSPDIPKAKEPGGYCVWFKIEVDNHEPYYGTDGKGTGSYISVHIATEVLQIKVKATDGKLGEFEYGKYGDADKNKLYEELLKDKYDIIYPDTSSAIKDRIDPTEIRFWLTDSEGGAGQTPVGSHWDVGTYYLNAQWSDTKGEHFVTFEWYKDDQTPRQPWIKIIPKKITALTWEGNAKWNDGAYQGGAADAGDLEDEFCWVYDRQGGTAVKYKPRAKFAGLDGDIYLTVEGEKDTAGSHTATAVCKTEDGNDIKNYVFDDGLTETQTFKIVKAKNSWTTEYSCDDWSVDDKPQTRPNEVKPVPKFGTLGNLKYYKDDPTGSGDEYNKPVSSYEVGTYYVRLTVAADKNGNYEGIDEVIEAFTVSAHVHTYNGVWQHNETQHWLKCDSCDHRESVANHEKGSVGHDAHQHWLICSECEAQYGKTGHSFGNYVPDQAATCTEQGTEKATCTFDGCGQEDIKPTTMIPHTFDATKWLSDGTNHWHECSVCHNHVEEVAHSWHYEPEQTPDCVNSGHSAYRQCEICEAYKEGEERQEMDALGHVLSEEGKVIDRPATCTASGLAHGNCAVCGESSSSVIPALGHKYAEKEITPATCTAAGEKAMVCTVCNATQENSTAVIPALGHDFTKHDRVEPTATETGSIEYYECSICEKCYRDQEGNNEVEKSKTVLPALGTGNSGGNLNPPLGGDTGLNNSGSSASDFFKENWWWMVLILAALLLIIITLAIISALKSRKREKLALERERLAAERDRERDRQLDTLIKMQMMHSYGGFNMAAPPADGDAPALDGQPQPAQLPYNQEMFNAAVSAAVTSALAAINHENGGNHDGGGSGGSDEGKGNTVDDVDGFYDDL